MLRKNATFELVLALESRWEYVTSLYGQLNVLQREERVLIDKLFYLLGHYQEAAVWSDVMTKSVIHSLAKEILVALSALNADDYIIRESIYEAFGNLHP